MWGGNVSLDDMFLSATLDDVFWPCLMHIAYWLNVGRAEYDAVSQRLQKKSKKKKKSKAVKLCE